LAHDPAVVAVLQRHPKLAADAVWTPQALALAVAPLGGELQLLGGGLHRYSEFFRTALSAAGTCDDDPAPHPLDIARLGAARLGDGQQAALHSAVPNYLCASAAEEAGMA
jgi:hypothetical protein